MDDQVNQVELTPFRVTKHTVYKIENVLDRRVRRAIREYIVRWRVYSWIRGSLPLASRRCDPKPFYVTFYSNASQSLYSDNTIAAFTGV